MFNILCGTCFKIISYLIYIKQYFQINLIMYLYFYRYLIQKYKHIDPTKIGVWGWSYGGYATGMMLATDSSNIIKCGISVAPVTDWLLYGKGDFDM